MDARQKHSGMTILKKVVFQRFLKHISRVAKVVKPVAKLNILADEPDNRILECDSHVKADYIAQIPI
ncbi:MAG: hypothetical protein HZB80_03820 [Deltaproteobacteria bacterium]|nr:hypothetical protein [Deltaproteobacteria bacterium]